MNELVKVDHKQFGLEENKAIEITSGLNQILEERAILEKSYSETILLEITKENLLKFRELRLKIRDNRTKGIQSWHKVNKEFYLRGGQFVDAIKNKEVEVNERMENALEENEKFFERQEAERIEKLKQERILECTPFAEFIPLGFDLGILTDEAYKTILDGAKLQLKAKQEAEAEAERIRLENERIEAERLAEEKRIEAEKIEAQRIENERLKKEAEKREAELKLEREKDEAERKRLAEIQEKKDAEQAEILRKEQAEKARIEKELQAKKDAEIKAEQERLAEVERQKKEAEKLAKAPIKKQLSAWVELFSIPDTNVDNKVSKEIIEKFNAFKSWSQKQIENL